MTWDVGSDRKPLQPLFVAMLVVASGCSIAVDGTLNGRPRSDAGAQDAVPPDSARTDSGSPDGAPPDTGVTDGSNDVPPDGELPDVPSMDANDSALDAAIDVTTTCTTNAECRDTNACNGAELCVEGACMPGAPPSNGTLCEADFDSMTIDICIDGRCGTARCGDGEVTAPEECDDADFVEGNGCDTDCTYSCEDDGECDDSLLCNGGETCNTEMHRCRAGLVPPDGTACMIAGSGSSTLPGTCQGGLCAPVACGNGMLDAMEECDASATTLPPGACRSDCTWQCEGDEECPDEDNDLCTGTRKCDTSAHLCVENTPAISCDDGETCTLDICDGSTGSCTNALEVDTDDDGYSPRTDCTDPRRGGDCKDSEPTIHPNAIEACNSTDDDCDGATDEGVAVQTYYRDGDGDLYGGTVTFTGCAPPVGPWITRGGDCDDEDGRANPGHSPTGFEITPRRSGGYDFNCDGNVTYQYNTPMSCRQSAAAILCLVPNTGVTCTGGTTGYPAERPACGAPFSLGVCPTIAAMCAAVTPTYCRDRATPQSARQGCL